MIEELLLSLAGGASKSYVYTQLGHLWQGSYNGNDSYQYLYCNATFSRGQHQLNRLHLK